VLGEVKRGTIDLATVAIASAAATFIPAYVGMYSMTAAGSRRGVGYAASFAVGVLLWSFSDVLGDSSYLGVNSGFGGGPNHASLIALFVLGFFALIALDRSGFVGGGEGRLAIIPFVVALGWGFHSLGEGLDIGSAALTAEGSIVDLVGGYMPGLSYVFHKLLEGSTIGAAYIAYSHGRGRATIPLLGLIFGIPTLIGNLLGYFTGLASTYFFALGSGASVYILLRLVQPVYSAGDGSARYFARCMLLVALGFLALYGAALFHSAG